MASDGIRPMRTKLFEPVMPANVTDRASRAEATSALVATTLIPGYQPPAAQDTAEPRLPSRPPATRTQRGLPASTMVCRALLSPWSARGLRERSPSPFSASTVSPGKLSSSAPLCRWKRMELPVALKPMTSTNCRSTGRIAITVMAPRGLSGAASAINICVTRASAVTANISRVPAGITPLHHTLRTVQGSDGALTSSRAGGSPVDTSG